jgi:hypothetical protein
MEWQPHASSSGAHLNTPVHPDLKRNTLFDVPGTEVQRRPELAKLTNFRIPSTEERRPELAKLNNFKIPGPEGQGRPELAKLTNFKVPGSDRQARPALSRSGRFDTPRSVNRRVHPDLSSRTDLM